MATDFPTLCPIFSFDQHFFYFNGKLIFEEECFFKLLSSLRKSRLNIPDHLTLEFVHARNIQALQSFSPQIPARITWTITATKLQKFDTSIYVTPIADDFFNCRLLSMPVGIYPDACWHPSLFSQFHCHRAELHAAYVFANENDFADVILLNTSKRIARTVWGDLLLKMDDQVIYPPKSEGATHQVLTSKVIEYLLNLNFCVNAAEISPFETQKADEILLVSEISGLHSVSSIRKKNYTSEFFHQAMKDFSNF